MKLGYQLGIAALFIAAIAFAVWYFVLREDKPDPVVDQAPTEAAKPVSGTITITGTSGEETYSLSYPGTDEMIKLDNLDPAPVINPRVHKFSDMKSDGVLTLEFTNASDSNIIQVSDLEINGINMESLTWGGTALGNLYPDTNDGDREVYDKIKEGTLLRRGTYTWRLK